MVVECLGSRLDVCSWMCAGQAASSSGISVPPALCAQSLCLNHAPHPSPLPFAVQEEYALRQAAIKAEPLEIIYSYYNGTGHRRAITVSVAGTRVGRSALHARLTCEGGQRPTRWCALACCGA